jgi:hypothetical protein
MKNLNPYNEDSFSFYKAVRSKKRDDNLISRLTAIDADIKPLYDSYDEAFDTNSLQSLTAKGYEGQEKLDLEALYDYDSATLTKLRGHLTTTASGRLVKCQNCTINSISTFDHFVPQSEFPEFIVHPKNLLCCCGDCNPRKGAGWRRNGERTVLNLYLDQLPNVQYLFVNVDIGFLSIETEFYLNNQNGIDPSLFQLLTSHYQRLKLFKRFSDEADSVISTFKDTLEVYRENHTLQETQEFATKTIQREQLAFGFNYWQSILKLELINNDDFLDDYV